MPPPACDKRALKVFVRWYAVQPRPEDVREAMIAAGALTQRCPSSSHGRELFRKDSGTLAANSLTHSLGWEFCVWIPSS